jgi:serine/threonine-protein kinase RsbW
MTSTEAAPADETAAVEAVELRIPADGAYLGVLRTATAGLAARRDFTLDEIEDLRIAVDEACALLLQQARPGAVLDCRFALGDDDLTMSVRTSSDNPRAPREDSLAWTLLTALAGELTAEVDGDVITITVHKRRGA